MNFNYTGWNSDSVCGDGSINAETELQAPTWGVNCGLKTLRIGNL